MASHCDVSIWLEGEPSFDVQCTNGSAWVWAPGGVTIHTIEGETGYQDLLVLERYFRAGLEAIGAAVWRERERMLQATIPGID